jgi:hypothetical protein
LPPRNPRKSCIDREFDIHPGQELQIYILDGDMHALRPIAELRGLAKGMPWKDDYRDHSERF